MGEIASLISPTITAAPIEVLIWVKPGVTTSDRDRVLAQIQEGLGRWAAIPTCGLRFTIASVIESATEPARLPKQLMIIVANGADVTSGGATFPTGGNPGTWLGAVADVPTIDIATVCAHEVGHAIGLHHSTVSEMFAADQRPVMHWATAGITGLPTRDDIATLSLAYPAPASPPLATTGGITGRLVIADGTTPLSGANVVAVDAATGQPAIGRLSGPRLTPYTDQAEGEFRLIGLPPGSYRLRIMDAHSYRGILPPVHQPPDGETFGSARAGYQADNFAEITTSPVTVKAGALTLVGDVEVAVEPMSFDGMQVGDLTADATYATPVTAVLPDGHVGTPYDLWLHVRGGVRDIVATVSGLPPGLTGAIAGDARTTGVAIRGSHFMRIQGTPTAAGHYTLAIRLVDLAGTVTSFAFNLSVAPYATSGLVASYRFAGNVVDSSGNGHHGMRVGGTFVPDRRGIAGGALAFDGVNDLVALPHEAAFDLPELTILAFLKLPAAGPDDDWLISKGFSFGNFSLRRIGSSSAHAGHAVYAHQTHRGNWSSLASAESLPVGRFFSLAVAVAPTGLRAYVDGRLVRQAHDVPPPRYNNSSVLIGAGGYDRISKYSAFTIDELQIHRGALSEDQIATLTRP